MQLAQLSGSEDARRRIREGSVPVLPNGCWEWRGRPNTRGYGRMSILSVEQYAHRVSYVAHVGPIPDGMQIDHLCRNRMCVNPLHMEAVTSRENTYRGESFAAVNAKKTHCPRGHEYTPGNTYVYPHRPRAGRGCRACVLGRSARRRDFAAAA